MDDLEQAGWKMSENKTEEEISYTDMKTMFADYKEKKQE